VSRFDVLIVGAGASGCSIAAHLLREEPGLRVAIVDRAHVGAGSTSRSTAAFRHQWSTPAHVAFSKYGAGELDRMEAEGVPVSFRRNGYLFLYSDEVAWAAARARVLRQRAVGVENVATLGPDEVEAHTPIGRALDRSTFLGATWGPDDGFLDPLAVAQGYLDEARTRGASYLADHRVAKLDRHGDRIEGVVTNAGETIVAGRVVLAAGIWSRPIARAAGLDLPLRPAKRHLYHSRPVHGTDVSGWPLVIGDRGQHARPSEGNTLMLAWERRPDPLDSCPGEDDLWDGQDRVDPGFDTGTDGYGLEVLIEMARHVPLLAEATALHRVTCGWYAVTPDHKAILGDDPRCRGLVHACGFSGHGIMHAPATGRVVAAIVLDRDPALVDRDTLDRQFGLAGLLDGRPREPLETMHL